MNDFKFQKESLLQEIFRLGYDSLRYSIFPKKSLREWEVVIEYDITEHCYFVYGTMDRGRYNKKKKYDKFEEAKLEFLNFLEDIVIINQYYVEEGMPVNYHSPLWNK